MTTNETTERTYSVSYREQGEQNLINKKVVLPKGIKGTNWQLAIISKDPSYCEVRSCDLLVNELTRRV